jgi:hypothetical protein
MAADEVPVRYSVSGLEAAVLIYALYKGVDMDVHADMNLNELVRQLEGHRHPVKKEILEAALYAVNLNVEDGTYWHPTKMDFDKFLKGLLPYDRTFNKTYNLIERKE